jgi:hypothetical protein
LLNTLRKSQFLIYKKSEFVITLCKDECLKNTNLNFSSLNQVLSVIQPNLSEKELVLRFKSMLYDFREAIRKNPLKFCLVLNKFNCALIKRYFFKWKFYFFYFKAKSSMNLQFLAVDINQRI